jgi:hypothetical protein
MGTKVATEREKVCENIVVVDEIPKNLKQKKDTLRKRRNHPRLAGESVFHFNRYFEDENLAKHRKMEN